jgi:hypothetical protein
MDAFKIEIKGMKEFMSRMTDIEKEQLPYASALALTRTAEDVRDAIIKELPDHFKIRSTWYLPQMKYGIRSTKATKAGQQSTVYTNAYWLPLQETGGIKLPPNKMLALPTEQVKANKNDIITASNRPRALMKSGKAWVGRDRANELVIFQRVGKGTKRGKKDAITVPYVLKPRARIPKRWNFYERGAEVARQVFIGNWHNAMAEALRTAK